MKWDLRSQNQRHLRTQHTAREAFLEGFSVDRSGGPRVRSGGPGVWSARIGFRDDHRSSDPEPDGWAQRAQDIKTAQRVLAQWAEGEDPVAPGPLSYRQFLWMNRLAGQDADWPGWPPPLTRGQLEFYGTPEVDRPWGPGWPGTCGIATTQNTFLLSLI